MISSKQNLENEAYKVGLTLLEIKIIEKFKLKINVTQTKKLKINSIQDLENLFIFQTQFKILKILALEKFQL